MLKITEPPVDQKLALQKDIDFKEFKKKRAATPKKKASSAANLEKPGLHSLQNA